jgi:hypothetical protein
MNRIKCSVSSCQYNDDGEVCKADEIKVRNNFGATDDMEFGDMEGETGARTSMETCCETFVPRKNK